VKSEIGSHEVSGEMGELKPITFYDSATNGARCHEIMSSPEIGLQKPFNKWTKPNGIKKGLPLSEQPFQLSVRVINERSVCQQTSYLK
jgi:hypothetical protein